MVIGHKLVREALRNFESISSFADQKHQHRQTFTKFHNGDGVVRGTAETYCVNWV
ncbi:MAG: hypothetical protein F6K62_20640 [Sphaerospermopsis sp. SIO1G2]|nr:hypothetical protein [Sphaerospermopsis sp. SIO1G2]